MNELRNKSGNETNKDKPKYRTDSQAGWMHHVRVFLLFSDDVNVKSLIKTTRGMHARIAEHKNPYTSPSM
jgi:hypothetical protein